MPLAILTDSEALANRKKNPYAGWGDRANANRVEPVALPHFEVPFKLQPGEKIFTVGSCFARNIEGELLRRGFVIPFRDLFHRPDFKHLDVGVINNYGTPSIYNEIAWGFGERPYDPKQHILEVMSGKFADIHLSPGMRPEPLDVVLERRRGITEAYKTAADCSVVIMTLGLSELWFDTHSGYYINVAPRPSLIQKFPGRFELHVLDFAEAFDYLERAILLLRSRAPAQRIILTVSPVPMMSTHRAMDVMVANTYSKSVLRTATEALVVKYDFVTYYPSFESVMLSDRQIAWSDDLVHVKAEIVAVNVGRMVEALTDHTALDEPIADDVQAVERARAAKIRGAEFKRAFFQRHGEWSAKNRDFAIEHAWHLLSRKLPEEALEVLSNHDASRPNIGMLKAQALVAVNHAREAFDLLSPLCERWSKSKALFEGLVSAAIASGEVDAVNAALMRYRASMAPMAGPACIKVAKWFYARGDKERAAVLANAASEAPLVNSSALELSEFLVELGRLEEAREVLAVVAFATGNEKAQVDRLQAFLGAA